MSKYANKAKRLKASIRSLHAQILSLKKEKKAQEKALKNIKAVVSTKVNNILEHSESILEVLSSGWD